MPDPEGPPAGDRPAPSSPEDVARLRHDARTFLTQIIGYSELLQEEAGTREDPALLGDLAKIEVAGRKLLTLLNENSPALFAEAAAAEPAESAAVGER